MLHIPDASQRWIYRFQLYWDLIYPDSFLPDQHIASWFSIQSPHRFQQSCHSRYRHLLCTLQKILAKNCSENPDFYIVLWRTTIFFPLSLHFNIDSIVWTYGIPQYLLVSPYASSSIMWTMKHIAEMSRESWSYVEINKDINYLFLVIKPYLLNELYFLQTHKFSKQFIWTQGI